MAEPTDSYPEAATLGGADGDSPEDGSGAGEARLREVLDVHGDDIAAALDRTDEAADVLETTLLTLATADEEEIDHLSESAGNLVAAADGLTTEGAAALATDVGENGDDLADALETVLELQREGHLDALATVATAFSEGLSPDERDALATLLEENGADAVEALDVVLTLQRRGQLDKLVDLAGTASELDLDAEAVAGLNVTLGAVGDAATISEPVGPLGFFAGLRSRDARAGLGFLLALLKAQGRRLRER